VHSGDSDISVARLVEVGIAKGLDGLALTDHNSVAGLPELTELSTTHPGMVLVPGCEVASDHGHVLALGVSRTLQPRRPLKETVDEIAGLGGVAILAHPLRAGNSVTLENIRGCPGVAVEAMNGRSWQRYNSRVGSTGEREGWTLTGGSDSHSASGVGSAWTEFPDGVDSVQSVLEALRRGEVSPGGKGLSLTGLALSKMYGIRRRLRLLLPGRKNREDSGRCDGP
jgi:predicted metal-dependent phosphoesterase TrpH